MATRCLGPWVLGVTHRVPAPVRRHRRCGPMLPGHLGMGVRRVYPCRAQGTGDPDERGLTGLDPALEVAVPADQRPVNELDRLKESKLSSWALLSFPDYEKRFGIVWLAFFVLVSAPVASQTFNPFSESLQFLSSASVGSFLAVGAAALRLYLVWSYVGGRLMSATVEYEETGWYDGQIFVKPPEVLTRDRLLGTYEVRPVLTKLKDTLLVCASCLLISTGTLVAAINAGNHPMSEAPTIRTPKQVTVNGVLYSDSVNDLSELMFDEEAAQAEADAQGGVPGYCGDRYLRASAGGHYCDKFDK